MKKKLHGEESIFGKYARLLHLSKLFCSIYFTADFAVRAFPILAPCARHTCLQDAVQFA